ncbi:MAG: lipopolysaccharide biosynthesis protein [Candidatus Thorarchaeota archaeon]
MADPVQQVERDRYTLNFVAESVSRALSFVGGLISTVILWRSIAAGSWTADDYGILKILTNTNQALLPLILLGITGAIVRVAAEFSTDKEKLGQVVGVSVAFITITYLTITISAVFIGLDDVLLQSAANAGADPLSLKIYWVIVLLTLLPQAYLYITKSVFTGIQQMKRNTYIDIIYSTVRILLLVTLFVTGLINILNVMMLNLGLVILASVLALAQLQKQMSKESIPWGFRPTSEIIDKIGVLASISLAGSLVAIFMNNVTVLWMNTYGTLQEVGLFSIAQGITLTARMVLAAPLVALVPNLTVEFEYGKFEELKRKFSEAARMIIPTYAFVFAVLFAFATPALRVLYGADSLPATAFLQLLAFNIIFVLTPGIYGNLFLAINKLKAVLAASLAQVALQIIWVVIVTPIIGTYAIAMIWVAYIPYLLAIHEYSKRKYNLNIEASRAIGGLLLGGIFAIIMYLGQDMIYSILHSVGLMNILSATATCLSAVPFWFLFITIATFFRLVNKRDLENLESVLKIIPPAWWISRPIIRKLVEISERKEH